MASTCLRVLKGASAVVFRGVGGRKEGQFGGRVLMVVGQPA